MQVSRGNSPVINARVTVRLFLEADQLAEGASPPPVNRPNAVVTRQDDRLIQLDELVLIDDGYGGEEKLYLCFMREAALYIVVPPYANMCLGLWRCRLFLFFPLSFSLKHKVKQ